MTTEPSTNEPPAERRRLQFGLGSLLIFVVAVAVGLSILKVAPERFGQAFLAAVCVPVVLGLVNEIRDLWRTFHNRADLSAEHRWGWRFAAFWRLGVSSLIVGYFVAYALEKCQFIALPEAEADFSNVGFRLREALLYLSLVIVLTSIPCSVQKGPPTRRGRGFRIALATVAILLLVLVWCDVSLIVDVSSGILALLVTLLGFLQARRTSETSKWSRLLGVLAACTGLGWCLYSWADLTLVSFLMHVAISGMMAAEPMWLSRETVQWPAHQAEFVQRAMLAAGVLLVNLAAIRFLARQWSRGVGRRLIWGAVLLATLCALAYHVHWIVATGMPRVSPYLGQAIELGPLHRWVWALLLVTVFSAAVAYRITEPAAEGADDAGLRWRQDGHAYFHQRRVVLVLLVLAPVVICWIEPMVEMWRWLGYSSMLHPFDLLLSGYGHLPLAVWVLAWQKLLTSGSAVRESSAVSVPSLLLGRFCVVWLALFVTIVLAVPTIAACSFAVWLAL